MGWHDTAQVCLNGHMINSSARRSPEFNQSFCPKCGAPTITACPACNGAIRGYYWVEGVCDLTEDRTPVPRFCQNCGKPFAWTTAYIEAAKALADEIDDLSDGDKLILKASIDDIVTDTPRTDLGIVRFKKYAAKAGKGITNAMRDILVDVVSETVKKSIWG